MGWSLLASQSSQIGLLARMIAMKARRGGVLMRLSQLLGIGVADGVDGAVTSGVATGSAIRIAAGRLEQPATFPYFVELPAEPAVS